MYWLAIDDDPYLPPFLRAGIPAGVSLDCAGSASAGIPLCPGKDVILMDVRMPDQDGLESVRELRALGFQGFIALMSSSPARCAADQGRAAGADAIFTKPASVPELRAVLREVDHLRQCLADEGPVPPYGHVHHWVDSREKQEEDSDHFHYAVPPSTKPTGSGRPATRRRPERP